MQFGSKRKAKIELCVAMCFARAVPAAFPHFPFYSYRTWNQLHTHMHPHSPLPLPCTRWTFVCDYFVATLVEGTMKISTGPKMETKSKNESNDSNNRMTITKPTTIGTISAAHKLPLHKTKLSGEASVVVNCMSCGFSLTMYPKRVSMPSKWNAKAVGGKKHANYSKWYDVMATVIKTIACNWT